MLLPHLRLRRGEFGSGMRRIELQQRLSGRDPFALAHIDRHDALGGGCRQGDAVVFERAQRLRRWLAAGG